MSDEERTYTAAQVQALLDRCYTSGVRALKLIERSLKAGGTWPVTPGGGVREQAIQAARRLVDEQAEDEGLWFVAGSIVEYYLQEQLRVLHAAVEAIVR